MYLHYCTMFLCQLQLSFTTTVYISIVIMLQRASSYPNTALKLCFAPSHTHQPISYLKTQTLNRTKFKRNYHGTVYLGNF